MARVGFNVNPLFFRDPERQNPSHQSIQDRDYLVIAIVRAS